MKIKKKLNEALSFLKTFKYINVRSNAEMKEINNN